MNWFRYRHELFDNGFGIEWTNENDEDEEDDQSKKIITEESLSEHDSIHHQQQQNNGKHSRSIITVRSINNNATRLPAHIWRSLAKVSLSFIWWNSIRLFRLYPVILSWNWTVSVQLVKLLRNVRIEFFLISLCKIEGFFLLSSWKKFEIIR